MSEDEEMMVVTDESTEVEEECPDPSTSRAEEASVKSQVYLPQLPLEEGEQLECDMSAYVLLRSAQTGSPCLSFDVVPDALGNNRGDAYPLALTLVAGTQAPSTHLNNIVVMRMSNLHRTDNEDSDDDDEELSDDEDDIGGSNKEPEMLPAFIKHKGCINRIRTTQLPNGKVLAASWSELGRVELWDLSRQIEVVNDSNKLKEYISKQEGNSIKPLFVFTGHAKEGFAVDWNTLNKGVLATGDCSKDIYAWFPQEAAHWQVNQTPLIGHTASVEDIQWSPREPTVLASCSVDKSIRVWDIRASGARACMLTNPSAHESDVNVIHWNRHEPYLVSGGDDGFLHVWDLRQFKTNTPCATFKHHTDAVTTVEWHPTDSGVFASGGADNQIVQWDLGIEPNADVSDGAAEDVEGVPPQLLFIHQGQKDVKELHWHPQIPGLLISTAQDFNIFRTISV